MNARHCHWSRVAVAPVLLLSASIITLGLADVAQAQTVPQPDPSAADAPSPQEVAQNAAAQPDETTEIIVTAQKREQSIQDVPIAITAITADTLKDFNYTDFQDYARLVPSLDFTGSTVGGGEGVRLRGISPSAGDPTVAFYLDETPLQDNARVGNPNPRVFDIDRVEVLRGPQGNLYGASSMGGTIRIIQTKPRFNNSSGRVSFELAHTPEGDPSYQAYGVLNVPLVRDRLAFRGGIFVEREGGFVDQVNPFALSASGSQVPGGTSSIFPANNVDDIQALAVRAALRFALTDGITLTPSVFHQQVRQGAAREIDEGFGRDDPEQRRFEDESSRDIFTLYNLLVNVDVGIGEIVSSSSLFKRDNRRNIDYTGFLVPIFGAFTPARAGTIPPMRNFRETKDFTQEIRFASDWEFPVQLLAGAFYTNQDRPFFQALIGEGAREAGVAPTNLLFTQNAQSKREEKAVFANLTYRPIKGVELQAGGRYFDIQQNGRRQAEGLFNGNRLTDETTAAEDKGTTLAFSASLDVTKDHRVYVRAAEGFRAGFSFTPPPRTAACDAALQALGRDPLSGRGQVEADSLWNYEVGAKTSWAGGRLTANVAAYRIEFSNIQQSVPLTGCGFTIIGNVGSARSQGVELEIAARPIEGLSLNFAVGYVSAKLTDDAPGLGATSGEPLTGVPKWTVNATSEYRFPVSMIAGDGFVRGSFRYVDERTTDFGTTLTGPTAAATLDPYSLIDLSIGASRGSWESSLFVDNVTDKRAEYSTDTFRRIRSFAINRPRTFGVRVSRNF